LNCAQRKAPTILSIRRFFTDFISTNVTATDAQDLTVAYMLMIVVAENASPEKIASGISGSELRTFIERTRDTLDTLSTDRNWRRSGTVSLCHELLLKTVASFSKHASFLKIFLSNEGTEAVARLYASRKKNDTPSHSVTDSILISLVQNSISSLTQECTVKRIRYPGEIRSSRAAYSLRSSH
jgi:hypothetical protein